MEGTVRRTGRRSFLTLVGLAVTASTAQTAAATEPAASTSGADPMLVDADLEPAEALLAYVEAVYGDRLGEDDGETILAGIEGSLASGDAFREVGLENDDEPAFSFSAYRGEQ
ncbi:hypothetical protein [Natronorarus salvus]|uniref:hypothetical protein n=1 Tax=Natronorarus salvus TaxID=3117733 RepID=UPI002F26BAD9